MTKSFYHDTIGTQIFNFKITKNNETPLSTEINVPVKLEEETLLKIAIDALDQSDDPNHPKIYKLIRALDVAKKRLDTETYKKRAPAIKELISARLNERKDFYLVLKCLPKETIALLRKD